MLDACYAGLAHFSFLHCSGGSAFFRALAQVPMAIRLHQVEQSEARASCKHLILKSELIKSSRSRLQQ